MLVFNLRQSCSFMSFLPHFCREFTELGLLSVSGKTIWKDKSGSQSSFWHNVSISESLSVFTFEALWTVTQLTVNLQHHLVWYFFPSGFVFFSNYKMSSLLFSTLCSVCCAFSVWQKGFDYFSQIIICFSWTCCFAACLETFQMHTKKQSIFENWNHHQ